MRSCHSVLPVSFLALMLAACASSARLPLSAGIGPNPQLPKPDRSLIPMVNVAPAKGWPTGMAPTAARGWSVAAFATGFDHPRWLYVLPNGDVLVAETNGPGEKTSGIKAWFFKLYQKKAGAAVPSANRITLLRDRDGDGRVDTRTVLLDGLTSPFGMALVGSRLFVANSDALVSFPYVTGDTIITAAATHVLDLPGGPINHHWTKNLLASPDGQQLYITVGSNSNVGEHGLEKEVDRAAIWVLDLATGAHRIFASGLRNPVGMAWEPEGSKLWTVVNERDEFGGDLVPDYLTSVQDGAFYGWPWSYYGDHVDPRPEPANPAAVATAIAPDYALGAHTASLGLAYSTGEALPAPFREGMFVGQHGSWNRDPRSGYDVIFVPFMHGKPAGDPVTVLDGFVNDRGEAWGRPVGVAVGAHGALLVADDVGNTVWRVTAIP
ncbi:MAG: sorbosone dehydrogenase family protein [Gemmatimonadota bacterium]